MPYTKEMKGKVESVQKQAVIFLNEDYLNREPGVFVLHDYTERCEKLGLQTLSRRRMNLAVLFIHKLISGRINAPALRGELIINDGIRSLRRPEFIRLKNLRTERALFSPFNLSCRAFNLVALFVDPTLPFYAFRERLLRLPDSAFGPLVSLETSCKTN